MNQLLEANSVRRPLQLAVLVTAIQLVTAAVVSAQSNAARTLNEGRAAALIARAESLHLATELPEKARLYMEASRLFSTRDVRASATLREAGLILNQLGQSARSLHCSKRPPS